MSIAAEDRNTLEAIDSEGSGPAGSEALPEATELDPRPSTFAQLYKLLPLHTAKSISKTEREANGYTSSTLTYGEIEYDSFIGVAPPLHLTIRYLLKCMQTGAKFFI